MILALTSTGFMGANETLMIALLFEVVLALPIALYAKCKGYPWWIFVLTCLFLSWIATFSALVMLPKRENDAHS